MAFGISGIVSKLACSLSPIALHYWTLFPHQSASILTLPCQRRMGNMSHSLLHLGTTKISLVFRRGSTRAGDSPILTFPLRGKGNRANLLCNWAPRRSGLVLATGFYAGRGLPHPNLPPEGEGTSPLSLLS